MLAVCNRGLAGAVSRELSLRHGVKSALLDGRVCFPWDGASEGPPLHGASKVVPLFSTGFAEELRRLRASPDLYDALSQLVEEATRDQIRSVLAPEPLAVETAGERPLRFVARCRVSRTGAERVAFGMGANWTRLKAAVRDGVAHATSWELEKRSSHAEVTVIAFFGEDHFALGVESPEAPAGQGGVLFPWSQVPRPGMEKQLAGAMAVLAGEALGPEGGVVMDPACGMGTLLLAVARLRASREAGVPQLHGRDMDENQLEQCHANFEACGLDLSGVRDGDALEAGSFSDIPDGGADALLCDLPCGWQYRAGADDEWYGGVLALAARKLRKGGLCVLLSTLRGMLARAVAPGPWLQKQRWPIGRGEGNLWQFQLIVLERI